MWSWKDLKRSGREHDGDEARAQQDRGVSEVSREVWERGIANTFLTDGENYT